jgi:hypothetical protein
VALAAGDHAVRSGEALVAAVERKAFENFVACLSDGTLAFQMQRLSELPLAAVVVEGRYSALFKLEHVSGAWLADSLARLQVRYPEIGVVFADSRKFAEEWTYRFLASALGDTTGAASRTEATVAGLPRRAAGGRIGVFAPHRLQPSHDLLSNGGLCIPADSK